MEYQHLIFRRLGINGGVAAIAALSGFLLLTAHWMLVLAFVIPRYEGLDFLRLHHSAAFGVDWIGEWWKIFTFPVVALIVFFVNGHLSSILMKDNASLSARVHIVTVILQIMFGAAGVIAVLLNV